MLSFQKKSILRSKSNETAKPGSSTFGELKAGGPTATASGKKPRRTWEENFQALVDFKREHGHCNVTKRNPKDKYYLLATWVLRVRVARAKGRLTRTQADRLDDLGFDFETKVEKLERQWNDMFKRLEAYRRDHLDCCVPKGFKDDEQLANWVITQRTQKSSGLLPQHRLRKLESIGFKWTKQSAVYHRPSYEEKWQEKYNKLVVFYQENGHCLVPHYYEQDPSLGMWVRFQRKLNKDGVLQAHRKELLSNLGFVWKCDKADADASLLQREWDKKYNAVLEVQKRYGCENVPNKI